MKYTCWDESVKFTGDTYWRFEIFLEVSVVKFARNILTTLVYFESNILVVRSYVSVLSKSGDHRTYVQLGF